MCYTRCVGGARTDGGGADLGGYPRPVITTPLTPIIRQAWYYGLNWEVINCFCSIVAGVSDAQEGLAGPPRVPLRGRRLSSFVVRPRAHGRSTHPPGRTQQQRVSPATKQRVSDRAASDRA